MTMTDPIADMLTRIRNANSIGQATVDVPMSKIKLGIAKVLKDEGYIDSYEAITEGHPTIRISLKYGRNKERVIRSIKRMSKPGRRMYRGFRDLPRTLNGLGISILSTPHGVLSDRKAREQKVGGELICAVW
ncbi:MAG: 30S ribosomal protein S8 [Planctomycetes bacterium]|nr:30S ribosomal protein S8 [Planctomycetota bacterium]